jgi:glycosyltransferase involved in cell wall biosynthesis
MSLPTLSLAVIARDEEKNINRFLDSVEGCFDEIIFCDTGSKDKTKEIAVERGCKLVEFEWCNDFAKARNYAFSHATSDFIMWMDLDDVLFQRDNFMEWKKSAMEHADLWFNTYHYTVDKDQNPIVSFMRERVVKRDLNPKWKYALHEGLDLKKEWKPDFAVSWAVKHLRDGEDLLKDRSRNINILEGLREKGELDARLQFYYGKELFENQKQDQAIVEFENVIKRADLEMHDRMLAHQYGCYSAQYLGDLIKDDMKEQKHRWYDRAIEFALAGLKLDTNRAEFYVGAGDSFLKKGDLKSALPLYSAAKNCINMNEGSPYTGAIFNFRDCYGLMPSIQMSKILVHFGKMDEAEREAKECFDKYKHPEALTILNEIIRMKPLVTLENGQTDNEDIVITCPPNQAYPFDEELYKSKGMGGSETALIEMARHLKTKTGRNVLVFNARTEDMVAESGVVYKSNAKVNEYFYAHRPKVHIAWRHNIQLTKGKTYLWCHDLVTGTVEIRHNFDKMLCLSEFHKSYVTGKQGVPGEKIIVTRNGIPSRKFDFVGKEKNPNKLVWMSSPDRGLDRAMLVCDIVRRQFPDIELHVYYGLENLEKYGMKDLADRLNVMMSERPYVKYHGFTEQNKMYQEVSDAVIWIHPCNFIETFCITALEMEALKIFPVTRRLGALANTLSEFEQKGQAVMLDHDCVTPEQIEAYANEVKAALVDKKWERLNNFNFEHHDWASVADDWIKFMEL